METVTVPVWVKPVTETVGRRTAGNWSSRATVTRSPVILLSLPGSPRARPWSSLSGLRRPAPLQATARCRQASAPWKDYSAGGGHAPCLQMRPQAPGSVFMITDHSSVIRPDSFIGPGADVRQSPEKPKDPPCPLRKPVSTEIAPGLRISFGRSVRHPCRKPDP